MTTRKEAAPHRRGGLGAWFSGLSLDRRFAVAGSLVTLIGMLAVGAWVAREIETGVVRNSAISTALYIESFIAPLSQELAHDDALTAESIARLRGLLEEPPVSDRIVSVKIWKKGGLVVYASDSALIGRRFPPTDSLRSAWGGDIVAAFDDIADDEAAGERATGLPLLEVYNPIHSIVTGEIIAVAEFYQDAAELRRDLLAAQLKSLGIVAAASFLTFAVLFGIVRAGSQTIARQNRELTERLAEVARYSAQNEALRRRIQAASLRASASNERQLRRISAELHDGPAQALALASLRLDSLARRAGADADDADAGALRQSLHEALKDIRHLCRGLSLPELEGCTLAGALELAIGAHERRTGTAVARDLHDCTATDRGASHSTLICVYRFVQEGLMNAWRHAGGTGQRVDCRLEQGRLRVTVADEGPGFDPERPTTGLGLDGLRERVESIGGEMRIESSIGGGTRLSMALTMED